MTEITSPLPSNAYINARALVAFIDRNASASGDVAGATIIQSAWQAIIDAGVLLYGDAQPFPDCKVSDAGGEVWLTSGMFGAGWNNAQPKDTLVRALVNALVTTLNSPPQNTSGPDEKPWSKN
jgi:hypothetical protein